MDQYTSLRRGVLATEETTQGSVLNENTVTVQCLGIRIPLGQTVRGLG